MRIVVDTNVVVSALVFDGVPQQVLDLAAQGCVFLYFSAPIQAEVERILEEKFGWSPDEIRARGRTFWNCGTRVNPDVSLAVVADDPDDNRILECALAARAEAIISGDRHLLLPVHFNPFRSQSPRQFLDDKAWEAP